MARYKYGKGTVLLSGPHPEADETWIDSTMPGNTTAESKMVRILSYFDIKKSNDSRKAFAYFTGSLL